MQYGALKFAKEAQDLAIRDQQGKQRVYSNGYMMVAVNLRTVLGTSAYEKMCRVKHMAMPGRRTVEKHMPKGGMLPHLKKVTEKTEKLLLTVCII